jgi:hypothetical protein
MVLRGKFNIEKQGKFVMFIEENKFEKLPEIIWFARPSVYQDSMDYVQEAYDTNWMTTAGANVDAAEKEIAKLVGCNLQGNADRNLRQIQCDFLQRK